MLDYPKVHRMVAAVRDVPDLKLARRVIDKMLPRCSADEHRCRSAGRSAALVLKLDPDAAARRAERAAKRRRVSAGTDADGTAFISATGLRPAPAAAAMERIDSCARAARAAGDERTLEQLRADCFVGLLNGSWEAPQPAHRSGVIELTVPLTTLIGLQDLPGDLHGWGPVCADIARMTAEHAVAEERSSPTPSTTRTRSSRTGRLRRPPAAMARFVRVRSDAMRGSGVHAGRPAGATSTIACGWPTAARRAGQPASVMSPTSPVQGRGRLAIHRGRAGDLRVVQPERAYLRRRQAAVRRHAVGQLVGRYG